MCGLKRISSRDHQARPQFITKKQERIYLNSRACIVLELFENWWGQEMMESFLAEPRHEWAEW